MPIDFPAHALSSLSLSLPPSAPDPEPAASWPTQRVFEGLLQDLQYLPVEERGSPPAERIYDAASPIKHWLDNPNAGLDLDDLLDRMDDIATLAIRGRLPLEHARRLLVPSEPSWLHDLNTSERVQAAYCMIGCFSRRNDLPDAHAAVGRALLLQLLEIEGDSPSRVLVSMNLCDGCAELSTLDREKHHVVSQLCQEMERMQFTPEEIHRALKVPRKPRPPRPSLFTRPT